MLVNLIKNALQKTSTGTIDMSVCYDEFIETLYVRVVDTGAGIRREEIPHMFEKIGKLLNKSELDPSQGNGLGLLMVKQIVERYGGQIQVASDGLGKGSCFSFSMQIKLLEQARNLGDSDASTMMHNR